MFEQLNQAILWRLWQAVGETLFMVIISGILAILCGLIVGVILYISHPQRFWAHATIYRLLGIIVNIGRSIPFIILMVAIVPFTRILTGSSIGNTAAIVPLTIAAIPFVARLVETLLNEIPAELIEAAQAMGATPWQIISKFLLPEARSGLVNMITITLITLIGYSAMAGAVGAGGLGAIGINYGYNRYNSSVMILTVIIMVVLVQLIQMFGDYLSKRWRHN